MKDRNWETYIGPHYYVEKDGKYTVVKNYRPGVYYSVDGSVVSVSLSSHEKEVPYCRVGEDEESAVRDLEESIKHEWIEVSVDFGHDGPGIPIKVSGRAEGDAIAFFGEKPNFSDQVSEIEEGPIETGFGGVFIAKTVLHDQPMHDGPTGWDEFEVCIAGRVSGPAVNPSVIVEAFRHAHNIWIDPELEHDDDNDAEEDTSFKSFKRDIAVQLNVKEDDLPDELVWEIKDAIGDLDDWAIIEEIAKEKYEEYHSLLIPRP